MARRGDVDIPDIEAAGEFIPSLGCDMIARGCHKLSSRAAAQAAYSVGLHCLGAIVSALQVCQAGRTARKRASARERSTTS